MSFAFLDKGKKVRADEANNKGFTLADERVAQDGTHTTQ